jgi:tetratricopeptide (TPR) repeat protein
MTMLPGGAVLILLAAAALAPPPAGPAGFAARKLRAASLQALGQWQPALDAALRVNREMPDDLETYALLVDAYRRLGRPGDAETQAQWMLNLRPEDPRGLRRAGDLRADLGDFQGALQMYSECFRRTSPARAGERAALLRRMAELLQSSGQPDKARQFYAAARR